MHIPAYHEEGEAKFWLEPEIELAKNYGLKPRRIAAALKLRCSLASPCRAGQVSGHLARVRGQQGKLVADEDGLCPSSQLAGGHFTLLRRIRQRSIPHAIQHNPNHSLEWPHF